jgi:hypothetical protein
MKKVFKSIRLGDIITDVQKSYHLTNEGICRWAGMSSKSLNELKKTKKRS